MRHTAAWNFLSLRQIRLISCLARQPPFHCLTLRRMDGVLSSPPHIQPRVPCKGSSLFENTAPGGLHLPWEGGANLGISIF